MIRCRKPQKTRKVIENEDLVDDMLFNAMKPEDDDSPIIESENMDGTSNRSSPHLINEMEINNDSSDVKPTAEDIDENFELPEGEHRDSDFVVLIHLFQTWASPIIKFINKLLG